MHDLPDFKKARVIVVGDVMLDRYWFGPVDRISPEAPVPVIHVSEEKVLPGGAANVALNLAALGVEVHLFGLIGADEAGTLLKKQLEVASIHCHLLTVDCPTITKLRVMGRQQQLLRIDFEKHFIAEQAQQLLADYIDMLKTVDAVVLSDYAKGTLSVPQCFIRAAKEQNKPIIVDPKSPSFDIYAGATVITPNLKEMENVIGVCSEEAELIEKTQQEIQKNDLTAILITRSEKGMLLVQKTQEALNIPTRAQSVYDVTGAGDTVTAVLSACLALQVPLEAAARLANVAAGLVVAKLGTATVSIAELQRALRQAQGAETGIVDFNELMIFLADCRARGEKIVFTNGCFDVLHSGHIQYLEEAKRLGARLVVAVNDDSSVKKLKGPSRPINPLSERLAVLSALRAVDWVTSFAEDTPLRLIEAIEPDILVKGGDYTVDQVVGADVVLYKGGIVKVLSFKPGCSTTQLIEKIVATVE